MEQRQQTSIAPTGLVAPRPIAPATGPRRAGPWGFGRAKDQPTARRAPALAAEPSRVRFFHADDASDVAKLFIATFRRGARVDRAAVADCIVDAYLADAGQAPNSLVHLDERGLVNGFIGVVEAPMQIGERPVRAGILGAFMAVEPERNPAIGIHLARACRSLPFDMLVSDTTIPRSLEFARAMRFEVLPTESLEWMKILRPAEAAAIFAARRVHAGEKFFAAIGRLVEPLFSPRIEPVSFAGASAALDVDGFLARADALTMDRALKPRWRTEGARRLVEQAALKRKNGPMRMYEVTMADGSLAGVYILYAERAKPAHALQVITRPGAARTVVASLLKVAERAGAPVVRGAADPRLLDGLVSIPGIFYHHSAATVAFSRDPEIRAALRGGKALVGGLVGDRWSRLVADTFS